MYENTSKSEKEKEFRQNHIDYFNHRSEKMQKVRNDIDEAIKSIKKYSDFKLILKAKGYENIKDTGKYFTMKTPYFQMNVRIDRVFGDIYSVQGIKDRIYGYAKKKKFNLQIIRRNIIKKYILDRN